MKNKIGFSGKFWKKRLIKNLIWKKFFLFRIISFSIGWISSFFWSKRSNIPLFLLILTHCIPYGIRGEEKHSTTPEGPPEKGTYSLNLLFFLFLFIIFIYFYSFFEPQPKLIRSYFNYPFLLSSFRKVPCLQFGQES